MIGLIGADIVERAKALCAEIALLPEEEQIDVCNEIKLDQVGINGKEAIRAADILYRNAVLSLPRKQVIADMWINGK